MVLLTASSKANKQPRCFHMCVFNFPTIVGNMNGSFVWESLLKSLKVQCEIKGKEFHLQFFASDQAAHRLILSWRLEVMSWNGVSKTKTDRIWVLNMRHSPVSLQGLSRSDPESMLWNSITQLHWVLAHQCQHPYPPTLPTNNCCSVSLFVEIVILRVCAFLPSWLSLSLLPQKSQFLSCPQNSCISLP